MPVFSCRSLLRFQSATTNWANRLPQIHPKCFLWSKPAPKPDLGKKSKTEGEQRQKREKRTQNHHRNLHTATPVQLPGIELQQTKELHGQRGQSNIDAATQVASTSHVHNSNAVPRHSNAMCKQQLAQDHMEPRWQENARKRLKLQLHCRASHSTALCRGCIAKHQRTTRNRNRN